MRARPTIGLRQVTALATARARRPRPIADSVRLRVVSDRAGDCLQIIQLWNVLSIPAQFAQPKVDLSCCPLPIVSVRYWPLD